MAAVVHGRGARLGEKLKLSLSYGVARAWRRGRKPVMFVGHQSATHAECECQDCQRYHGCRLDERMPPTRRCVRTRAAASSGPRSRYILGIAHREDKTCRTRPKLGLGQEATSSTPSVNARTYRILMLIGEKRSTEQVYIYYVHWMVYRIRSYIDLGTLRVKT